MSQPPERPLRPHDVIASRVRELRQKRGWSAKHLADELQKVGLAWDRSIVANFEHRRRETVSVEELLALAYVFSVAPLNLMVPIVADDHDDAQAYEPVPNVWVPLSEVRDWVRGYVEPFGDPRISASERPEHEKGPDRHGMIKLVEADARMAEQDAEFKAKYGRGIPHTVIRPKRRWPKGEESTDGR